MNVRELRNKICVYNSTDVPVGDVDSKRLFMLEHTCYAKIEPVSARRMSEDVAAFDTDRTVSHRITIRYQDVGRFKTVQSHGGTRTYKVQSHTTDALDRFVIMNCILTTQNSAVEQLNRSTYGS